MKDKDGIDRLEVELAEVEIDGGHDYIPQIASRDEDENIRFEKVICPVAKSAVWNGRQRGGTTTMEAAWPTITGSGLVGSRVRYWAGSGYPQNNSLWTHKQAAATGVLLSQVPCEER